MGTTFLDGSVATTPAGSGQYGASSYGAYCTTYGRIEIGLALHTAPTEYPITLTEAKAHLRVTGTDSDTMIQSLIAAATAYCEGLCDRQFCQAAWRFTLPRFVPSIYLPRAPLIEVTQVDYVDTAGAMTELATGQYVVSQYREPGVIMPAYGCTWPATCVSPEAVIVSFTSGYEEAASVPDPIKHAIKLVLGSMYEHAESVITGTIVTQLPEGSVGALLGPYRVGRVW
jgi:uncharacterized phiE125 gp8 family phage protein